MGKEKFAIEGFRRSLRFSMGFSTCLVISVYDDGELTTESLESDQEQH